MSASNHQIGGTHYQKAVQPWDAMQAWMTHQQFAGFLRGNAIKYLARCEDKGGIEDLRKARHYLDKLIEIIAAVQDAAPQQIDERAQRLADMFIDQGNTAAPDTWIDPELEKQANRVMDRAGLREGGPVNEG